MCFFRLWGLTQCVQLPGVSRRKAQECMRPFQLLAGHPVFLQMQWQETICHSFDLVFTSMSFIGVDYGWHDTDSSKVKWTTWRRLFSHSSNFFPWVISNGYILHPGFLIAHQCSSLMAVVKILLMWKMAPKKFLMTYWGPFQPELFYIYDTIQCDTRKCRLSLGGGSDWLIFKILIIVINVQKVVISLQVRETGRGLIF